MAKIPRLFFIVGVFVCTAFGEDNDILELFDSNILEMLNQGLNGELPVDKGRPLVKPERTSLTLSSPDEQQQLVQQFRRQLEATLSTTRLTKTRSTTSELITSTSTQPPTTTFTPSTVPNKVTKTRSSSMQEAIKNELMETNDKEAVSALRDRWRAMIGIATKTTTISPDRLDENRALLNDHVQQAFLRLIGASTLPPALPNRHTEPLDEPAILRLIENELAEVLVQPVTRRPRPQPFVTTRNTQASTRLNTTPKRTTTIRTTKRTTPTSTRKLTTTTKRVTTPTTSTTTTTTIKPTTIRRTTPTTTTIKPTTIRRTTPTTTTIKPTTIRRTTPTTTTTTTTPKPTTTTLRPTRRTTRLSTITTTPSTTTQRSTTPILTTKLSTTTTTPFIPTSTQPLPTTRSDKVLKALERLRRRQDARQQRRENLVPRRAPTEAPETPRVQLQPALRSLPSRVQGVRFEESEALRQVYQTLSEQSLPANWLVSYYPEYSKTRS